MVSKPGNPKNDLYKTLSAPTYSIAETSRLTGISRGRVSRYLRGYRYEGGELDPVISRSIPAKSTYASFLDLIDLTCPPKTDPSRMRGLVKKEAKNAKRKKIHTRANHHQIA